MRFLFVACLAAFLFSCRSSDKKNGNADNIDSAYINNSLVSVTTADLPPSIKVSGKLIEAWQWTDKSGENILITSFVEPYDDKEKNEYDEEGKTSILYAVHYVKKEDNYELLWKNEDVEKSCPFDMTCEYLKGSTTITDLDNNGVAETTIQYKLACRSDVSPAEMKLIMHEGTVSYSLKGICWVKVYEKDRFAITEKDVNLETLPGYKKTEDEYLKTFGRYQSEKGFDGAPPEFLDHARRQWIKFAVESFE